MHIPNGNQHPSTFPITVPTSAITTIEPTVHDDNNELLSTRYTTRKHQSRYTLYVGMAWTQYMPIQTETFKTQSIKSKLILSLYGHLTFIFRHCIINKAPKVAKSIAKVLNLKVAKLPSCSFFVFLSSDGLCISKLAEGS